jgi:BirA family biotin operon repressor/biotin-[acetyl-CoA-carboxylase] ligase
LGSALTFSLLWRFNRGVSGLAGLSLAVGVALVRALRALSLHEVTLKWPNDLLGKDQSKLGGILIEAQGDMLGPSAVVIGIGLNLTVPETVRRQVDQPLGSLADSGARLPGRNHLLAITLAHLQEVLEEFTRHGFAPFQEEWMAYPAGQGRLVRVILPDGVIWQGVARGVTVEGALQLETTDGMRVFNAGEVSLRWA